MPPSYAPERPLAHRPAGGWPSLRLGVLDRYLLRIMASRMLLCLGLIFAVMMLERTLRLATQMAAAGAHLGFLWPMMLNLAPHYLGLALPPAFMLALLLGVERLDGDFEIEAMLAGGFPLRRIIAVLVGLGLAAAVLGLLIIGFLEPLGRYGFRVARDEASRAGWTARLQPLAFQRRGGGVTVTADAATGGGHRLGRVFIQRTTAEAGEAVLTAASGELRLAPDGRTVTATLKDGRFHLEPPSGRPSDGRFVRYALTDPYAPDTRTAPRGKDAEERTLPELVSPHGASPAKAMEAELAIRLARLAALPLLPFLALPLGLAARRGRSGGSFVLAGVAVMGLHECLRVAQSLSVIWDGFPSLAIGSVLLSFAALAAWVFLSSHRLHGESGLAWLVQQLQRLIDRRPRLSLRLPWPSHPSLGGYVTRRLMRGAFAAWAGLSGMLATIDLFEKTDDIMARGLGLAGLVHYGALRVPVIAEQVAPLAALTGAVVAYGGLARGGELVALRVLGVSPAQIMRMSLPVALALSCLTVALAEQVSPRAQLALAVWWRATAPGPADPAAGRLWFRAGEEIVTAARADGDGARLDRVVIYRRDAGGMLTQRLSARAAELGPVGWRLRDAALGQITQGGTRRRSLGDAAWSTPLRAADVRSLAAAPLQVSAVDSLRAVLGRAGSDQSRGFLLTRLHRALAEPLAPLIMMLLALPLAKATSRPDPPRAYLAWAMLGGLVYVVADGVLTAAAQTGLAPPWFGAWLTPLAFSLLGAAVAVFCDG